MRRVALGAQVRGDQPVAGDGHAVNALYAFALLAVLIILNARNAGRATRHELLGFVAILVLVAVAVQIPVRTDVMVFTAIVVAIVGYRIGSQWS